MLDSDRCYLYSQYPLRDHHRQGKRQHREEGGGTDGERGIARVQPVAFRHHGDRGCSGQSRGGGNEDGIDLKSFHGNEDQGKLGKQTEDEREDEELDHVEIVYLPIQKYLFGTLCRDQRARNKHRDGGAEVGEILQGACDKTGQLKANGGCFQQKEDEADDAGDCAEINKRLFEGQLDVVALSSHNNETPGPEQNVEADAEEGCHKLTSSRQKRLKDGKADKGAIGEHKAELRELLLIYIFIEGE